MKKTSRPEKINIEENSVGINFKKSKQIEKHLTSSSYPWKDEISSGPVINDSLVIYVDSKRLKDIIELESLKIINNIEKKLGFSVNSIRVELQNSQQ